MKKTGIMKKIQTAGILAAALAAVLLFNACGSPAAAAVLKDEAAAEQKEAAMTAEESIPVQAEESPAEEDRAEAKEEENAGTENELTADALTENRQAESAEKESEGPVRLEAAAAEHTEIKPEVTEVGKNTQTGAALVDEMYEKTGKNTVMSPISIQLALAMALEGAEGRTKEEIEQFLGTTKKDLDSYVTELMKSAMDEADAKVIISNAFWYLTGQDVNGDYLKKLQEKYAAETSDLNFPDSESAARIINAWCSDHTNGLIPTIVSPADVKAQSDLILNTIWFKCEWKDTFGEPFTETFHGFEEDSDADFLGSKEHVYYENEQAVAFAKPYLEKYSFIGILPKEEGEFRLSDLDLESLLASRTTQYDVNILMPKLDIDCGGSLLDILAKMGVTTAFSPAADFSGIAKDLRLSDVIHKTKLILDENGTEAAAATAVMMLTMGMPANVKEVKTVELTRPYAFLIADDETGTVLFAGKVTMP